MKNPFYTKVKAIERKEKEPSVYIFTKDQLIVLIVWCVLLSLVFLGIIKTIFFS